MTAPHLGPGHTIAGKYAITALLGFTGEVATYRVNSHQGEMVVRLFDPAIAQRADVMAELERVHNGIHQLPAGAVRVVDAGYDVGTGAPFAATELVAAPSLAQLIQGGPMTADGVAAMLARLAEVLDAAHAHGLVHRGLKATNVFVEPSGAVRITDFNSAVIRSTSPTHEAYARSAPWWAPEQMHPSAALGPSTDVFAAGLLAFFALTGRTFWVSCQSTPPDLQAWQAEVMADRPSASQRAAQLGVSLNPLLDSIFARALKVHPGERFQSVGELARALGALTGPVDADNPKTMAFEAFDFPDPSQQAGVPHAGPGAGPGYPSAPGPMGSYPGAAPAAMPSGPDMGGPPPGREQVAMAPGLPPIPVEPKKKKSPIVPVVIGVVVALVVFGGVGAYFVFGDDEPSGETQASAKPASGDGDKAPDDAGDKADDAKDDDGDGTAGKGGGDATDSGDAPKKAKVTITCKPVACTTITVDGKQMKLDDEHSLELDPGKHVILAAAPGYNAAKETIEVKAGDAIERDLELKKMVAVPVARPKPCGQFLKPCK